MDEEGKFIFLGGQHENQFTSFLSTVDISEVNVPNISHVCDQNTT